MLIEEYTSTTPKTISEKRKKILQVLARADSPVPIGYISLHTGIREPLEILEKMREESLVFLSLTSTWSCSIEPCYEITPATKEKLLES